MKSFIKFISQIILLIVIFFTVVQLLILVMVPSYDHGEYTMTYKVYYPNSPKVYTVTNEWPIFMESYYGTNKIIKVSKFPYVKNFWGESTVFESSAPIEIVSYTFK